MVVAVDCFAKIDITLLVYHIVIYLQPEDKLQAKRLQSHNKTFPLIKSIENKYHDSRLKQI